MNKILLAEDDLFLRDIYTETLQEEGFKVSVAIDGGEALQKLKEGGWDLVLLDVVMPQLSGIDVLKQIKGASPQAYAKHIVFMTNSDERKDVEEVMDMIDGFILKSSFTPDQLIEEIKGYLSK